MTRKQIKGQAARYTKFVEWSDEDRCFIGRCPELMLGGVHGDDHESVAARLNQLGRLLQEMDNWPGAERCFKRALQIHEMTAAGVSWALWLLAGIARARTTNGERANSTNANKGMA